MAKKGESSATASATVEPPVKAQLITWRSKRRTIARTRAIMKELKVTATTANDADLGCPAPNSLLTLTLHLINN